ncbi:hypothetical protein Q7P35_004281 [Cladosporium inversicolor]
MAKKSHEAAGHNEDIAHQRQRQPYDYGGNPLAHIHSTDSARLPAFGGAAQPGLYKPPKTQIANPAPLGLAGFALTTFLLSCVNLGVRGLSAPTIVIAPALVYGGFIQLLAGMWEIAVGNVFGGTALSSYGGFWIGLAIILIPGGFEVEEAYGGATFDFYSAFAFYIFAWFIFTFLLWLVTLKSTLAFSSLFAMVWIAFIFLGAAYLDAPNTADGHPNVGLTRAGGVFGMIAAFIAWYNMLAGIMEPSNSFFAVPVVHFPWSEKGRANRRKSIGEESMV